jgi:hypothetical protein
MKSSGSKTKARVPSFQWRRRAESARPSFASESGSLAIGGRARYRHLEAFPVVGLDLDLGMQGEALDVAAQLPGQEERAGVATAAEALDAGCGLLSDGHPALHRGGVQLGEQRLVGLKLFFVVLGPRKPAAAHEVAQDAAVESGRELDHVLVGERLGRAEDRPAERARARVDSVEHQRMEGRFQTALPFVDPRRSVSFGVWTAEDE